MGGNHLDCSGAGPLQQRPLHNHPRGRPSLLTLEMASPEMRAGWSHSEGGLISRSNPTPQTASPSSCSREGQCRSGTPFATRHEAPGGVRRRGSVAAAPGTTSQGGGVTSGPSVPKTGPLRGGGGVGVWKIPRAGGKGGMPHFRSEGPRAITSPCEAVRGFGRISPSSWPPSCVRGPVPLAVAERPPPAFGDATWAAPRSRSASLSREGGASPNGAAP